MNTYPLWPFSYHVVSFSNLWFGYVQVFILTEQEVYISRPIYESQLFESSKEAEDACLNWLACERNRVRNTSPLLGAKRLLNHDISMRAGSAFMPDTL